MKALIYNGPGDKSWAEAPQPQLLHPSDVIVRVDTTTICGTDLHILKGDVPAVQPGRILGHEGVGTVVETGTGVQELVVGDRVLISCIKSCGHCPNCRQGLYSHCLGEEGQSGIGWVFGHLIDGTQAEFVRVPYADNSLYRLPPGVSDVEAVMLSDILPTGFEIGVLSGGVKPGDVVAVIGAGPVGLAAIATAGLCGAGTIVAIDRDANRLAQALEFGATDTVDSQRPDWRQEVIDLTDGAGVDVSIEAVGLPETFAMALSLARPGGRVANVGVHGSSVDLPLQELWIQNISISMGLVNTNTTPMLLKLVAQHKIPAAKFATHTFSFDQVLEAYDTFARAAETKALKVIITRNPAHS
ncbi:alcohol dehydrogenase [Arthrobacter silviterrae]|uniref:Zinc-dependent alcohol dehydrogenase family protein n=1 Tax=Arthrobacter silviterrae TaxID=2026658 RepID=A0ABX0DLJ4_9MICC|nr:MULTISPECIES: zinc-dependent alcohol dehydrogenase family protein [Arthrobacter]MCU6482104.1 zinc-dependent alcohol dehydrogenase family protein [Arthrobacter sp. A2-55]MDQ0275982.1 alcohol dehydrogenase [Arthrobacter silviterrae]NGN85580.1 zinc-dependent alcohol dehydrogenase family protein [Arthrobacter silviterrae]